MRPKTAKMMGGGFKVSKRDKVGFKIDVEIRGMDKENIPTNLKLKEVCYT